MTADTLTPGRSRKRTASILTVGAAACVACCAGPILAFLSALGIAGVASTLLIGVGGLAITAAAIAAAVLIRRRRTISQTPDNGPVPVAAPTRLSRSTR